jgi:hypothetical protein
VAVNELTSADAVTAALDEFDTLGRDPFLARYGFGRAHRYYVERDGDEATWTYEPVIVNYLDVANSEYESEIVISIDPGGETAYVETQSTRGGRTAPPGPVRRAWSRLRGPNASTGDDCD